MIYICKCKRCAHEWASRYEHPLRCAKCKTPYWDKETRFWAKVARTPGCWIWNGCHTSAGYGQIRLHGEAVYAHRLSWEMKNGPVPVGIEVLHKCDNPACVNPEHLFLGTQSDNINDCVAKGRFNRPFGEVHPRAKLTKNQVEEIRKSKISQRKLAQQYEVSRWAIQSILHGRSWRR